MFTHKGLYTTRNQCGISDCVFVVLVYLYLSWRLIILIKEIIIMFTRNRYSTNSNQSGTEIEHTVYPLRDTTSSDKWEFARCVGKLKYTTHHLDRMSISVSCIQIAPLLTL